MVWGIMKQSRTARLALLLVTCFVSSSLFTLEAWAQQTQNRVDARPSEPAKTLEATNSNQDSVASELFEWTDTERNRQIPAKVFWPDSKLHPGPRPLVIVSHGLGGSRMGYRYLGEALAKSGFVAVHPQHLGSDRALWSRNPFTLLGNFRDAAQDGNAVARAFDVSFVINHILKMPNSPVKIDPDRIAIAGHSYGANTAMLIAGAKVSREQVLQSFNDARVKAAIIISAPPFYGDEDLGAILGEITIPTLHITGTNDFIRVPGYRSGPSDRRAVFEALAQNPSVPKTFISFRDATHSMFTGWSRGEESLNKVVQSATAEATVTFLKTTLLGQSERSLATWIQQRRSGLFAEIETR